MKRDNTMIIVFGLDCARSPEWDRYKRKQVREDLKKTILGGRAGPKLQPFPSWVRSKGILNFLKFTVDQQRKEEIMN